MTNLNKWFYVVWAWRLSDHYYVWIKPLSWTIGFQVNLSYWAVCFGPLQLRRYWLVRIGRGSFYILDNWSFSVDLDVS